MLGFVYVCVAFLVVVLVELSPKLYCHDVAFVLLSVTLTVKGASPLCGMTLNPAFGKMGVAFTVTCFVVDADPLTLLTVCVMLKMPDLVYLWVAFFVVTLVELSPKLYCHDVAFVLLSVT